MERQKDKQQLVINRDEYDEVDNGGDGYKEPLYAKFLRTLGCCIGYSCIPCFGGCCGNCCYPYKTVNKGSRAVIQEFGRFKREVGDGMHYVNPVTEAIFPVNQRIQVIDLAKQEVMT